MNKLKLYKLIIYSLLCTFFSFLIFSCSDDECPLYKNQTGDWSGIMVSIDSMEIGLLSRDTSIISISLYDDKSGKMIINDQKDSIMIWEVEEQNNLSYNKTIFIETDGVDNNKYNFFIEEDFPDYQIWEYPTIRRNDLGDLLWQNRMLFLARE